LAEDTGTGHVLTLDRRDFSALRFGAGPGRFSFILDGAARAREI